MNVADALHGASAEQLAVVGIEGSRTYGELAHDAARLSASLRALGLARGDRVGIVMPNSIAHVVTYYAAIGSGNVVVAVNPKSTTAELRRAFRLTAPRAVIAAADLVPIVRTATKHRLGSARVEIISDAPARDVPTIAELIAAASEGTPTASMQLDDPASILLTSGSTGQPKGVTLTHGNVAWAARAQASRMEQAPGDAVALVAPLHHCYGQNAVLNATVFSGAAVVVPDSRRTKQLVNDLATAGVTALPAVPALFRVLLDLRATRDRLPALRYAMSAAAPLPRQVADEWLQRFGFRIHEGYGLTETSPCALYNDQRTSAVGSLGRPLTDVQARVVDNTGAEVPTGTVGELSITGPNVMLGYFADPEATATAIPDGWLRTGDHVRCDQHGDYWFVGRGKEVIIVSGMNVFPAEVESVLQSHPWVADAVVVGRPHHILGETVIAYVQPNGPHPAGLERALQELCRAELAAFKRPSSIRSLDVIPALASGKPDLARLRRLDRSG